MKNKILNVNIELLYEVLTSVSEYNKILNFYYFYSFIHSKAVT